MTYKIKLGLQDFRGLTTNIAYFVLRIQRALRNTKYAIRSNPTKSQRADFIYALPAKLGSLALVTESWLRNVIGKHIYQSAK